MKLISVKGDLDMLELNVEFQEIYKSIDQICKDMLKSNEGISEYIRQMEAVSYREYRAVNTWEHDYKQLKHMRWLRNKLAHEVGTLNSDLCTHEDVDWLNSFRKRILTQTDPLAILYQSTKSQQNHTENRTTSSYTQNEQTKKSGCYVATCVYGSYDCPQVWTLRRFRDNTLNKSWYGRLFIRFYYAISPSLVRLFGKTKWFKKFWKKRLDRMIEKLQTKGIENTPYNDKI